MEPRAASLATTTRGLNDLKTLPIKSTTKNIIISTSSKKIHSESLPGRSGYTSRAASNHQAGAIGAGIVGTARNIKLKLLNNTRIPDWLHEATSRSQTYSRRNFESPDLIASAVRPKEVGDCGGHRQRGGSEESGGDEDNVELHYGER